jgi:PAS domain S-box-containing protein
MSEEISEQIMNDNSDFSKSKMVDIPLYNTRIIKSYVEYINEYHPEVDIVPILDYANIMAYQLEDEGHWLTQKQIDRFQEILLETIGDPDMPRKVGQYTPFSRAAGKVSQYTLGFMTPAAAYTVLEKLYPHMSRGSTLRTTKVGATIVEAVAIQNPGVKEKPYQCANRQGIFEGMAKLFTNKFAEIDHHTCMHVSGDRCCYTIKWEETPSFSWKRIVNYSILIAVLACPIFFFLLPINYSVIAILLSLLLIMGLSIYHARLEKDELTETYKKHGDMASSLLDEINMRYNNAMLVQEIGQASSNILNIDELLKFTMETFEKRLDYGRGLIMLADKKRTHLIPTAGYGYSPADEALFRNTEFHLDNPKSKGPFVVAFKDQKPFLVNDIQTVEKDISSKSREFAKQLGASAFICVPIVYEGKSEGIIAVDSVRSKRTLNQSDLNLLLGIALQIGTSINNARSYQLVLEREERFRALSENAPDIIYTINTSGIFSYINPSWERILGHTKEEVIGKYFVDFVNEEDIDHFNKIFEAIYDRKEQINNVECTIPHRDGSERLFTLSGAPNLDGDGKIIGIVGIFKDISEQKKLEAQLLHAQKMEAIGTLAGGIAHDFNNLLTGIQGYTSLMFLDMNVCHPFYDKLKGIEDQVRSCAQLTKQLLGVARGGKYEVSVSNMNDIIEKTSTMFGRTKKEISIYRNYEKDVWAVEIDRGQIEQVLLNIYVNAWQAMPSGGSLYLDTANIILDEEYIRPFSAKPGKYVKVSVADTGIGMDENTKARIFEPFFTTKELGRGTGLGLASAYGIIKVHNGIIDVESEEGCGSTFTIYLPASDKDLIKEEEVTDDLIRGEGTILLVDDEDVIIDVGKESLEVMGYSVLTARSGQEAVEIFQTKHGRVDLVILDMIMPGMNGMETFDILKSMNPDIKVILSSGYSAEAHSAKIMERGCSGFIQKPYGMTDLSRKVREVLDKNIS